MEDDNTEFEFDFSQLSEEEHGKLVEVLKEHVDGFDRILAGDEDQIQISPEVGTAIQDKLLKNIRRGDLSAEIIRFGTEGFLQVFLAILNPTYKRSKS